MTTTNVNKYELLLSDKICQIALPEHLKVDDVINKKPLEYLATTYKIRKPEVLIQGSTYGVSAIFFSCILGKNVTVLEPNNTVLPITKCNVEENGARNVQVINQLLSINEVNYDVHYKQDNNFSYIIEQNPTGNVSGFSINKIDDSVGVLFIDAGSPANLSKVLIELDKNEKIKDLLIIIRRSLLADPDALENFQNIDERSGFVFLSKQLREMYTLDWSDSDILLKHHLDSLRIKIDEISGQKDESFTYSDDLNSKINQLSSQLSDLINHFSRQREVDNKIISTIDNPLSQQAGVVSVSNQIAELVAEEILDSVPVKALQEKVAKFIELNPNDSLMPNRFTPSVTTRKRRSKLKMAGLAAIPSRESALERVVKSLIPQVDRVGVYLNNWEHIPEFLNHPKVVVARSQDHGDLGDAGKFFWVDNHKGYYFSCDDDLVYPSDYVERIIKKIEDYDYKAVIGWHGSVISDSFKDYYDPIDRRVFSYSVGRPFDIDVHILGTGVLGFHTSTLKVHLKDFERPNMADIFFARLGQQQKIRFVVMEHLAKEIETIEAFQEDSINKHGQQQVGSVKNVRAYKNEIATAIKWRLYNSQSLNIAIIGRFENFKKGGIHKSNLLIQQYLQNLGHQVTVVDSQAENNTVLDKLFDVCIVYPGDPNRPDYPEAVKKMDILRNKNVPILLNMSYNSNPVRSKFIVESITAMNADKNKAKVCLMAFAESVKFDPILRPIQKYVVSFPKTIEVDTENLVLPSFHEREGIFFGDATKLNNVDITNGKIVNWVSEVRKRLPKTNFYVIKHYSGEFSIPNFQFAPFMDNAQLMQWMSSKRLSICLNQFTTYEMVPVESQSIGTPVVYRSMPQSLNEALGLSAIPVSEPSIFGEMCAWLYNDEFAWQEYSNLSLANFKRNHISLCKIGLETAMRKVIAINKE